MIQDNTFCNRSVWKHIMNINEVKHNKCDWSSDTLLYLQSGINVLSACHFTCSPKTQQEHNFRKSLIISYRVNFSAAKFSRNTLLSYIVVSQKFKLKLISAKFLLPMISRNELSITLSTLWVDVFELGVTLASLPQSGKLPKRRSSRNTKARRGVRESESESKRDNYIIRIIRRVIKCFNLR